MSDNADATDRLSRAIRPTTNQGPFPSTAIAPAAPTAIEADSLPSESAPPSPPAIAPVDDGFPIDLATAVHLSGGDLAVALAREQMREASSRVRAAEAMVPSIRLGLNYNKHEGVIQQVDGVPISTSRGAAL